MKPKLTALFVLISCSCIAQKNNDSLFFQKLGTTIFKIDFKKTSPATIPFNQIQVIDARADTSCVGFFKYSSAENVKKLVFINGLKTEIVNYASINYQLTNDSSNKLLIVIKEYRISNYAKHLDDVTIQTEKDNIIPTNPWKSGVVVSSELFLQNENAFHALYKIDTVLINDSTVLLHGIIQKSFAILFNKISNKKLTEIHIGKTEFSKADIIQHNESFFNCPILKDSILKKGIYKNFTEFKMNNPSIKNFELNRGKLSDEIYVSENNKLYPLRNFWGLCDGKNLFIRSADNLFLLIRTNNTFNVKGTKALTINNHALENTFVNSLAAGVLGVPPAQSFNNSSYVIRRTPLQLNMQNGELY